MSILKNVRRGRIQQPNLWLVYGVAGVGKSSLGSEGPSPIFIGPESGTANLDVVRLPAASYADVLGAIKALTEDEHDYQTVVIDSLDWLEPLVWQASIDRHNQSAKNPVESIEDFGYGKGYVLALDEWRKMVAALTRLREKRQMNIVLVAHPHIKVAKDPTVVNDYERYQLKLHEKAAALFKEFVDCVFFINYQTLVANDPNRKGKARAVGLEAADRYIYTEWTTAYDAKNRFGLDSKIPYEKGLGWKILTDAINTSNPDSVEVILRNVENLFEQLPAAGDLRKKVRDAIEANKTDRDQLSRLQTKLKTIVNTPTA